MAADAPVEDIAAYMNRNGNDLTRPALEIVPVVADVFAALEATAGCRLARLSGAGPTAFGLFANDDAARAAAAVLRARHPDWWIVATSIS